MKKSKPLTPAVKYFFGHLERRTEQMHQALLHEKRQNHEIPFEEVEHFFRDLMSQNIFILTVGVNGKRESTIFNKAVFSMNKVVRVYYSTSFDEDQNGFIRISPNKAAKKILVERMHGYRPKPELLYASSRECHVIRFMVRWLMRRIDWDKTKINNLDLYKVYKAERQAQIDAELEAQAEEQERLEAQEQLAKHKKGFKERRKSRMNNS